MYGKLKKNKKTQRYNKNVLKWSFGLYIYSFLSEKWRGKQGIGRCENVVKDLSVALKHGCSLVRLFAFYDDFKNSQTLLKNMIYLNKPVM